MAHTPEAKGLLRHMVSSKYNPIFDYCQHSLYVAIALVIKNDIWALNSNALYLPFMQSGLQVVRALRDGVLLRNPMLIHVRRCSIG